MKHCKMMLWTMSVIFTAMLLVSCNAGAGSAANRTSIEGKVYRSDPKKPDRDASVAIFDAATPKNELLSAESLYQTTTNSKGEYRFVDVQPGTYIIVVSLQGDDPALSTCTMVPEPDDEWFFSSISFDAVGRADVIRYGTVTGFTIAAGEILQKDLSWVCK